MLSIIKNIHFLSHRFSASGSQAQLICVLSSVSQKTVIGLDDTELLSGPWGHLTGLLRMLADFGFLWGGV